MVKRIGDTFSVYEYLFPADVGTWVDIIGEELDA